jgi:hypothetical protein
MRDILESTTSPPTGVVEIDRERERERERGEGGGDTPH